MLIVHKRVFLLFFKWHIKKRKKSLAKVYLSIPRNDGSQLRFGFTLRFLSFVTYYLFLLLGLSNFSWHWPLMCWCAVKIKRWWRTRAELIAWSLKLRSLFFFTFFQNRKTATFSVSLSCCTGFLEHWFSSVQALWSTTSASKVTTLWRYTTTFIIIIIIIIL